MLRNPVISPSHHIIPYNIIIGPPTEADLLYQHDACKQQNDGAKSITMMNMRNASLAMARTPYSPALGYFTPDGFPWHVAYIANSKMQIAPATTLHRVRSAPEKPT
jgi:hypothetical protein